MARWDWRHLAVISGAASRPEDYGGWPAVGKAAPRLGRGSDRAGLGAADHDERVMGVRNSRGYSQVGRYDRPKRARPVTSKTESVPEKPNTRAFRIRGRTRISLDRLLA
jgi:hypothetical protein